VGIGDGDGDGLLDDCDGDDVIALREALAGFAPPPAECAPALGIFR